MGGRGIFKIDRMFTKELHRRLSEYKRKHFPNYDFLPSMNHIEEIVLAVLWASIMRDEGRVSRFTVGFGEPNDLEDMALIFRTPRRLTAEELGKLAHAARPPTGLIGVWPREKRGQWLPYGALSHISSQPENWDLYIWGLQTTGLMKVKFQALDPGRVIVGMPGTDAIAEITGQGAGFISDIWQREARELMEPKKSKRKTGKPLKNPARYFLLRHFLQSDVMKEILTRVRLLGHGGSLIFVPNSHKWERSLERPVFYSCEQTLNEIRPIQNFLNKEIQKLERDYPEDSLVRANHLMMSSKVRYFIGNAARSIAYLSSIDGATILCKDFTVFSFGAKIKASRQVAKAIKVTRILPLETMSPPEEIALDQEFRGTRHLSAALFVLENPGTVAFVVSQDGGITGLTLGRIDGEKSRPRLLAYKALELLL